MARKKQPKEQPFTQEQYDAVLAEFSDQRAKVDDLYLAARRRGEITRCENLYEYWRQIVHRQREWLLTHPAPDDIQASTSLST